MIDCTDVVVRDEHVAMLRAILMDEPDAWESFHEAESEKVKAIAYAVLIYAAFRSAVMRKFSPTCSSATIVRFVADLRIALAGDAKLIHAGIAEDLIREALGNAAVESLSLHDAEVMINTQLAVLGTLVAEAELDEAKLEEFIQDSTDFAREWIAVRQGGSRSS